ncbi:MAG: hypothetical protein M3238_06345 [Actinomycetota bacterium]|nr:hypothetical protein [Actinomycetota bacterium]
MRAIRVTTIAIAIGLLLGGSSSTAAARLPQQGPRVIADECPAPPKPMTFGKPGYIDMVRAGGEPTVQMHPDGTMLYGSHAGTTHFYSFAATDPTSAAFLQNYTGQAYYYFSKDNGKTWEFVPRTLPPDGLPGSGFSDPDFAIDKAGNVFVSEINLLNIAISKSEDSGKSYELKNFFAFTITDRQWKAADEKDVVYMVGNTFRGGTYPSDPVGNTGHILIKSKDGGETFSQAIEDPDGLGDIHVDQRNGTLYETHLNGGKFEMWAFRNARRDKFEPDRSTIADGVAMLSHWPAFDIDSQGNLYLVWDESGEGDRAAGVYYSYSTDEGRTWAHPIRVDETDDTDLWPWLAVGARGKVAIAWLEASEKLPGNDAETSGDHGWRIVAAQSLNGLGCGGGRSPSFRTSVATPKPIHRGTICNSGTVCQAQGIDRRLGDYFSIEIDGTGALWAGYSDTRQGGAVALPGYFRQTGGPRFGRNTSMP